MRKFSLSLVTVALSTALLLSGCGAQTPQSQNTPDKQTKKVYKIGVSQIVAHPALDLDQKGFLDEMKAQGFIEGENAEFIVKNSQGDPNLAKTIADQFVSDKVDLIAAISTPSAQAAAMAAKQTGIPVVYIAVTDPVSAGLIKDFQQPSGTNITGVYNGDSTPAQMDLIKEIQPSIKTLGVIYNAGEANSVATIENIKKSLQGTIKVVEVTVASSNEVQAAAQSLVGRVDAVFMPQDNTVMSAVDTLIKTCQNSHIPLYTGDVESVKKGALATLGNDEYDCGRQSGVLAARILKGEKAGDILSERVRKNQIVINQKTAEAYGVTVPQSVLDKADEVVK